MPADLRASVLHPGTENVSFWGKGSLLLLASLVHCTASLFHTSSCLQLSVSRKLETDLQLFAGGPAKYKQWRHTLGPRQDQSTFRRHLRESRAAETIAGLVFR